MDKMRSLYHTAKALSAECPQFSLYLQKYCLDRIQKILKTQPEGQSKKQQTYQTNQLQNDLFLERKSRKRMTQAEEWQVVRNQMLPYIAKQLQKLESKSQLQVEQREKYYTVLQFVQILQARQKVPEQILSKIQNLSKSHKGLRMFEQSQIQKSTREGKQLSKEEVKQVQRLLNAAISELDFKNIKGCIEMASRAEDIIKKVTSL